MSDTRFQTSLDQVLSIPSVKAEHPNLHAEAIAELATLRAQLEEVKRVIEPFASESDMWGSKTPDTETPIIKGSDGKGDEAAFTVGDLRAAAAWYQKVTTA